MKQESTKAEPQACRAWSQTEAGAPNVPLCGGPGDTAAREGHHDGVPLLRQGQTPLQELGLSLHVILTLLCFKHAHTEVYTSITEIYANILHTNIYTN